MITPKLINDCILRNEAACRELYYMCYQKLMNISYRYQSNEVDAEGVVNNTFMKIVENLDKYNLGESFDAWISRICINTNIDEYRKRQKRNSREQSTGDILPSTQLSANVYNKAALELETEDLHRMIVSLPPKTKQVFLLFAVEGYSHKEIGDLLDISEGSSRWHVSEARKILKGLVESQLLKMSI